MQFISHNLVSVLILSINLATTLSYFIIYSKENLKTKFFRLPVVVQKLYVVFFVAPLFVAPFFSVAKFTNSKLLLISVGIIISILGLAIIVLSFLKIGVVPSIKSDGKLSTTGTYRIVRHPIYFGTIIAQLGFILINQALVSLIYLPFSIILYYIMATIEEKDLVNMFGKQYSEFKLKTKGKVIPYIL
jgi:protein-S-isoprenylcysteine O-methyltransferase Ste14